MGQASPESEIGMFFVVREHRYRSQVLIWSRGHAVRRNADSYALTALWSHGAEATPRPEGGGRLRNDQPIGRTLIASGTLVCIDQGLADKTEPPESNLTMANSCSTLGESIANLISNIMCHRRSRDCRRYGTFGMFVLQASLLRGETVQVPRF
jgi:hypothetical protein